MTDKSSLAFKRGTSGHCHCRATNRPEVAATHLKNLNASCKTENCHPNINNRDSP